MGEGIPVHHACAHHVCEPTAPLGTKRLPANYTRGVHVFQAISISLLAARHGLEETLENTHVFLEDVWKTLGRRGHLSRFGLEDVNLSNEKKNII